jgi:adenosine deaminase
MDPTLVYFENMPKIELHVHVEGATSAEVYYQLAQKNQVALPVDSLPEWQRYFEFTDFNHFISVYISAVKALKHPADYTHIIEAFYEYQSQQNILYTEAYLSASFLVERFDDDEILDAIETGIQNGQSKHNVVVRFIPDIARQITATKDDVLRLVVKGYQRGIFIGLGLGGIELGFPPELFESTYKKAQAEGLKLVAHAGEVDGASSIWGAITQLNAARIGHGIRCLDDDKLVAYLVENQVPIEVSPTSNYCTKVIEPNSQHPIKQMVEKGIFCNLNSDDPAMFSTSLAREYWLLYQQGFSLEQLWQLNFNALEAAFLSEEEKTHYKKQLQDYVVNTHFAGIGKRKHVHK